MTARPTALLFAGLALSHLAAQATAPQQQPPTFDDSNGIKIQLKSRH
jgi:hypothetical protein